MDETFKPILINLIPHPKYTPVLPSVLVQPQVQPQVQDSLVSTVRQAADPPAGSGNLCAHCPDPICP